MKTIRHALIAAFLGFTGVVQALPTLQLTIAGGSYVGGGDDTTYAGANSFTLYALLSNNCNGNANSQASCLNALLADTYYISAALVPKTEAGVNLGSFDFDASTVNVTSGMVFGTPPLDALDQLSDPGDLSSHGIFDTYFAQFAFKFDADVSTTPFNAEPTPPSGPLTDNNGGMYFAAFDIDITNFTGTGIHFDLYNTAVVACGNNPNCVPGDIDKNDFAPFSHDAQSSSSTSSSSTSSSSSNGGPPSQVPEPGTLSLLGCMAILGGLFQYRRRRQSHA